MNKRTTCIQWKAKYFLLANTLLFTLAISSVKAQESMNSSGSTSTGSGGSVSYSIGQLVYSTHTSANGLVAQGVQQTYEISEETGIKQTDGIQLTVRAYPNPTVNNLTLSVGGYPTSHLSYHLYDANGKLLRSENITGNQTHLAMSHYSPNHYLIKIMNGKKEVKTFKIVKTN